MIIISKTSYSKSTLRIDSRYLLFSGEPNDTRILSSVQFGLQKELLNVASGSKIIINRRRLGVAHLHREIGQSPKILLILVPRILTKLRLNLPQPQSWQPPPRGWDSL